LGVLVLLGTSYALFSAVLKGEKKYTLESGGLRVYLDETKTEQNITLSNVLPVSDEEGMENTPYHFSLVNEEKQDLAYTIYLKEEAFANKTPSGAIKYHYTRDIDEIKVTRNMTEQKTDEERYYLETGVIPGGMTYNYTFRMWIDLDAGNEILNTRYSVMIEIEASQTTKLYKEEILNGTDPVLSDNLVPVIIENDGTVKKASLYKEWYNYSKQEWANVVVLEDKKVEYKVGDTIPETNIQSYFVWIPKYSYELWDLGNYTSVTSIDSTKVHTIPIKFGLGDTSDSVNGECTTPGVSGESGNCKVGDYMTHPAFQAFDSNGFWVGKFESGYKGATTTAGAEQNNSDYSKLIIKPNAYSWRSITVGNAFDVSYNYLRSDDSHMMKNAEWGAVAYLQHSQYGSSRKIRINNYQGYQTGYSSVAEHTCGYSSGTLLNACNSFGTADSVTQPYNTVTGYMASTTNNITGVYDMAGGSFEYVMGYFFDSSKTGGDSNLTNLYGDFFTNSKWTKYYDAYLNASQENFSIRILGDAIGEMGPFANTTDYGGHSVPTLSWYSAFGYLHQLPHWLERGGGYVNGLYADIFQFTHYTGTLSSDSSFRVVLTPIT